MRHVILWFAYSVLFLNEMIRKFKYYSSRYIWSILGHGMCWFVAAMVWYAISVVPNLDGRVLVTKIHGALIVVPVVLFFYWMIYWGELVSFMKVKKTQIERELRMEELSRKIAQTQPVGALSEVEDRSGHLSTLPVPSSGQSVPR